MDEQTNPFVYGCPVHTEEELADRASEKRQLIADANSGQPVILCAPRRYGKTSLARVVCHVGRDRRRFQGTSGSHVSRRASSLPRRVQRPGHGDDLQGLPPTPRYQRHGFTTKHYLYPHRRRRPGADRGQETRPDRSAPRLLGAGTHEWRLRVLTSDVHASQLGTRTSRCTSNNSP